MSNVDKIGLWSFVGVVLGCVSSLENLATMSGIVFIVAVVIKISKEK